MSEGKEIIVAEHPKAWVVRMVEGCGEDAVVVERAFGAFDDVLSDRECWVKRKHLSLGRGAAPRWTTSPSGLEKFTPSRSDPESEAGFGRFGSGVVSGSDSASFRGDFWAMPEDGPPSGAAIL